MFFDRQAREERWALALHDSVKWVLDLDILKMTISREPADCTEQTYGFKMQHG